MRLVPVVRGQPATAACDVAHFGAVELFRGGQWGRICTTDETFRNRAADMFVLDAQVPSHAPLSPPTVCWSPMPLLCAVKSFWGINNSS